jgi:hypothetical protein
VGHIHGAGAGAGFVGHEPHRREAGGRDRCARATVDRSAAAHGRDLRHLLFRIGVGDRRYRQA